MCQSSGIGRNLKQGGKGKPIEKISAEQSPERGEGLNQESIWRLQQSRDQVPEVGACLVWSGGRVGKR